MQVKQLVIKQLGPIKDILIEPRFSEDGLPIPIALVGQNGAGKSLALSVVLDAMTEARRQVFREIQEISGQEYLRISSKQYIQYPCSYSHVKVVLSDKNETLQFDEIVSRVSYSDFENLAPELAAKANTDSFKESGFYKNASISAALKDKLQKLPFLYFPYFRYEPAYWMSSKANVDFAQSPDYYGVSKLNPIRTNVIEETRRWVLNLILDREVYEKKIGDAVSSDGVPFKAFLGYHGSNTLLLNMVNDILSAMMKAKEVDVETARLGIGPKGKREISVHKKSIGKVEEVVAPDMSLLSSGELMILGLSTEIIRIYELIAGRSPNDLSEVTGIVLIDEIDLHLHFDFQRKVLPAVIRKFPAVQFIFTTHSPLFLIGMAESGEIDIYNLPAGNRIAVEDFSEFGTVYNAFIEKNQQFQSRFHALQDQVMREGCPIILTEGKTDWQHMKIALTHLQGKGDYTDLNVEFFEFDSSVEMGEVKLRQICEHMAILPHRRKMIFIFDRDNQQIIKDFSGDLAEFKDWGNNTLSLCLPVPPHRAEYKNLSIELYYQEETLRASEPESGKRLWFDNEIEIVSYPGSDLKLYKALSVPHANREFSKKPFDSHVSEIINDDGKRVGLSKSAFVQSIIKNPVLSNVVDFSAFRLLFDVLERISG